MGLAPEQFWMLTPFEFTAARNAWHRKQEAESKEAWMRASWIAFRTTCPPKGKTLRLDDFSPFGKEKKEQKKTEPVSAAEQEKRFRKMVDRYR